MAVKTLYVCDICSEQQSYDFLNHYEIHSDLYGKMRKARDTLTLSLCEKCGNKVMRPFSTEAPEEDKE